MKFQFDKNQEKKLIKQQEKQDKVAIVEASIFNVDKILEKSEKDFKKLLK